MREAPESRREPLVWRGTAQLLEEGREEGRAEERARARERVLAIARAALPADEVERLASIDDIEELTQAITAALAATRPS